MSDTNITDGDDSTSNDIYVAGSVGTAVWTALLLACGWCLIITWHSQTKPKYTRNIFAFCCIFFLLDLPRYIDFIVVKDYNNQYLYGLHLLSFSFFYAAFAQCCQMFAHVMSTAAVPFLPTDTSRHSKIANYCAMVVFNPKSLNFLITFVFLLSASTMIYCMTESSLDSFKDSKVYVMWLVIEYVTTGLTLVSFLTYGISLRLRLISYLLNDASVSREKTGQSGKVSVLQRTVNKMTTVMVCSFIGFISRMTTLVIKLVVFTSDEDAVKLHNVAYFIFADFIPRGLTTGSFLVLIGNSVNTGNRTISAANSTIKSRNNSTDGGYSSEKGVPMQEIHRDNPANYSFSSNSPMHGDEDGEDGGIDDNGDGGQFRESTFGSLYRMSNSFSAWEDVSEQDLRVRNSMQRPAPHPGVVGLAGINRYSKKIDLSEVGPKEVPDRRPKSAAL